MKTLAFLIPFLLSGGFCNGQETDSIYQKPDESAQFPGGKENMYTWMAENVRIQPAGDKYIDDRCVVKFVVDTLGNISNIQVISGIPDCPECDEEIIRIVKLMPKFKPALRDGKPITTYYEMPVYFR